MYIFIFVLLPILILLIELRLRRYKDINKIPGPSWLETFKFFFLKSKNEDAYNYIITLPEKYGSVVRLWLKPFKPILVIADPKYYECILASKDHVNKTAMYDLFHDVCKNGLVTNRDATAWRNDRKLLRPAFSKQAASNYTVFFANYADKIKEKIQLHENEVIDIVPLIHRFVLGIVVEFLTEACVTDEEAYKFINALDGFLEIFLERNYSIFKRDDNIFRMTANYKSWKKNGLYMRDAITEIFEKQKLLKLHRTDAGVKRSVMDFLLETGLSRDSILSQLETFTLAGFDTSSSAIAAILFEISKNPVIQEEIYKEYLKTMEGSSDSVLTFELMQEMTYTENVVKEALRIYPPVPLIQRRLKSPLTIDGITIPDDIDLVFSIPSLHNLHFDRPKEFDPDRFRPENLQKIPPYTYAPFSIGPRDCIGRRIAMAEVKFVIVNILKNFSVHCAFPEHKLKVSGEMSLKIKNGVPVIFKKRE